MALNSKMIFVKIIRQSLPILVAASVISSAGGIAVESLVQRFALVLPLLVMLPALNDMIGDFGTIVAPRFTTLLYLGKLHEKTWRRSRIVRQMLGVLLGIAAFAALYLAALSTIIALVAGWMFDAFSFFKIVLIALTATTLLVAVIFYISIKGGFYVFRKGQDPDNLLVPLATSIADMGNLILMSALLALLF